MLSVAHNIKALGRDLSDAARKQVPYATSLAINDTLADIQRGTGPLLEARLDRPTPFTKRGTYLRRASKRTQAGQVGFKRIQAAYLSRLEEGGTNTGRGQRVPVNARTNKHGNMPRGGVKRLLASPRVFSGKPKGKPGGIYRRVGATAKRPAGRQLRIEVAWSDRSSYAPQLGWRRMAHQRGVARLPKSWAEAFRKAMATRR